MDEKFSMFAAAAGLAAIERFRVAVDRTAEKEASAALTEWLFWWGVLDEKHRHEPTGDLDQEMRRALREARNSSTHRSVVNGILHSALAGAAIVGITRVDQGWELAWSLGESIPLGDRGKDETNRANHAAYVARLAGQSTHLAAGEVGRWLAAVAGPGAEVPSSGGPGALTSPHRISHKRRDMRRDDPQQEPPGRV